MTKLVNILWFDDDFEHAPLRVKLWTRWFEAQKSKFKLIPAGTIVDFARALELRAKCARTDADYIDAILLDVMLRVPSTADFAVLGFSKTKWLALDAGAQVLGLMKNTGFNNDRPDFLKNYVDRPTALLTSQTTVKETWSKFVEHGVRNNEQQVGVLIKGSVVAHAQSEPSQDFRDWLNGIATKGSPK